MDSQLKSLLVKTIAEGQKGIFHLGKGEECRKISFDGTHLELIPGQSLRWFPTTEILCEKLSSSTLDGLLKIWHGGLASHGGVIGIFVSLYLYCRTRPDQPYVWLLDRVAVATALGATFIRLGNLFNSEILGTPTTLPWAIVFERYDSLPRHPAQLYESLGYFCIFWVLLAAYHRWRLKLADGVLIGAFLIAIFGFRFLVEFVKLRQAAYGHDLPLSVGQWLSLPVIGIGVALLVLGLIRSPRAETEVPTSP